MFIYKITNLYNNKVYIGKTKNIQVRWKKHKELARKGINRYLYDAIRKYGETSFIVEQIEECSKEIENEREIYWIAFYKSNKKQYGYNMTLGGDGGDTYSRNPHKEETSRKLKLANTGKKRSKEFCAHMKEVATGRKLSSETREKIKKTVCEKVANREIKYNLHMLGKFGPLHHNYIVIDKAKMLDLVNQGASNKVLAKEFGISLPTVIEKFKEFFGMTPLDYRSLHKITRKIINEKSC